MTRVGVVAALWAAWVLVTWNVVYDQYVIAAAVEFTRDQVARYHEGKALSSIHEGFSPQVRQAAWRASMWVAPIIAAGAVVISLTVRRGR